MNKDREKNILEILLKEKEVGVKDLAKRLYASEPSIRRDLASMEKQLLVRRTHGGAVLVESKQLQKSIPFLIREMEESNQKLLMAKKALQLIKDNDVIMLDSSTAAYNIVPFLDQRSKVSVITNGIRTLEMLGAHEIPGWCTGGRFSSDGIALIGEDACQMLGKYNANIAFCSCAGVSLDGKASDYIMEENYIRQQMWRQSEIKVLMCTSSKLDRKFMHTLCLLEELDYVISDVECPKELADKLGDTVWL